MNPSSLIFKLCCHPACPALKLLNQGYLTPDTLPAAIPRPYTQDTLNARSTEDRQQIAAFTSSSQHLNHPAQTGTMGWR